jgi:hypothetical protein
MRQQSQGLKAASRRLARRDAGMMLEDALTDARLAEARISAARHDVSSGCWPSELRDADGQEGDEIVLSRHFPSGLSLEPIHVRNDHDGNNACHPQRSEPGGGRYGPERFRRRQPRSARPRKPKAARVDFSPYLTGIVSRMELDRSQHPVGRPIVESRRRNH